MKSDKSYKFQITRRSPFIVLGIGAIWLGIRFYNHQWSYMYGFPVPKGAGVVICIIGLVFLLYGIIRKSFPKGVDDVFVVCVSCLTSFYAKDISNNTCPKCNGNVENIDDFYTRHPEHKA